MVRIDKVYTKGGDAGQTSLVGGDRVSKASLRIDCYGTVDELNAALGLVRTALDGSPAAAELLPIVVRLQNELFDLGAELATPDAERRERAPHITLDEVEALEREIDRLNAELPPLKSFILPGGGLVSSYLHVARTVCRRAERRVVSLAAEEDVGAQAVTYLNRLSDALFVFGRWACAKEGIPEPLWQSRR
jgi:cob(I)alamin adenosyltransferase